MMSESYDELYLREPSSNTCDHFLVGGKARNLWLLGRQVDCPVPSWFAVTTTAFTAYTQVSIDDFIIDVQCSRWSPVTIHKVTCTCTCEGARLIRL